MRYPIYIYPLDVTGREYAAILRDLYRIDQFTEEEVIALDGVIQLRHQLGCTGDGSRPSAQQTHPIFITLFFFNISYKYRPRGDARPANIHKNRRCLI